MGPYLVRSIPYVSYRLDTALLPRAPCLTAYIEAHMIAALSLLCLSYDHILDEVGECQIQVLRTHLRIPGNI